MSYIQGLRSPSRVALVPQGDVVRAIIDEIERRSSERGETACVLFERVCQRADSTPSREHFLFEVSMVIFSKTVWTILKILPLTRLGTLPGDGLGTQRADQ